MIEEVSESGTEKEISINPVRKFRSLLKVTDQKSRNSCLCKAMRWWNIWGEIHERIYYQRERIIVCKV